MVPSKHLLKRIISKSMPKVTAVMNDASTGGCISAAALGPCAPLPHRRQRGGRMPAPSQRHTG